MLLLKVQFHFIRIKCGFLPVEYASDDAHKNNAGSREDSMELFQKTIAKLLEPLKSLAHTGFKCDTADNVSTHCHFAILNYCCDIPEARNVLGVGRSNKSRFPCHRCYVPSTQLSLRTSLSHYNVEDTLQCRSEVKQVIIEGGKRSKSKMVDCLDKFSLAPHQSFLETFPFTNVHPLLEPYFLFTYEPLHNRYLGISVLLKNMCSIRLRDTGLVTDKLKTVKGEPKSFSAIRSSLLSGANQLLAKHG